MFNQPYRPAQEHPSVKTTPEPPRALELNYIPEGTTPQPVITDREASYGAEEWLGPYTS